MSYGLLGQIGGAQGGALCGLLNATPGGYRKNYYAGMQVENSLQLADMQRREAYWESEMSLQKFKQRELKSSKPADVKFKDVNPTKKIGVPVHRFARVTKYT